MTEPILEVRGLRTEFLTRRGIGVAVDGISFDLGAGESLGIVGESGCGKSLTALSILRLNPTPSSTIAAGEIYYDGKDLLALSEEEMRRIRGGEISMVLQDPTTSLNPVFKVGWQILESLRLHSDLSKSDAKKRAEELLRLVNIPNPRAQLDRYPHQFSGGMRQRVVGAIALAGTPKILIADEPTTALDVTIQAAYLSLLKDIQAELGLSIIFISHDFSVIGRMCDRVAVMYAGHIVEMAPIRELFRDPKHPYTAALMKSIPDVDESPDRLYAIEGSPPSIFNRAPGCPFADRCPVVEDRCREEFPGETRIGSDHLVSCWRYSA